MVQAHLGELTRFVMALHLIIKQISFGVPAKGGETSSEGCQVLKPSS